ncbi:ladinin-1 isoform X2 [Amia ocellicauda]|uniref:ladinin-1 isoform X2 n=1 Tax=Amia ocellicauda TaxID=2972642 RepID=UPI003464D55C
MDTTHRALTRQWTVEDEEEVERERRRRIRNSTVFDPSDSSQDDTAPQPNSAGDDSGTEDQTNLEFLEILKSRDERRKKRHVETLWQQREEEMPEMGQEAEDKGQEDRLGGKELKAETQRCELRNSTTSVKNSNGNVESKTNQETDKESPSRSSKVFKSSLSFSLDKTPTSPTGRVISPLSPTSPPGQGLTHSPRWSQEIRENGDNQFTRSSEQPGESPIKHQSPRSSSFRIKTKTEETTVPVKRSASVRMTSRTIEDKLSKAPNHEDDKPSPFQRNSRQRISSRTIEEKLERLAMAAQKSETLKSSVQKDFYLLVDEVARKRGVFERERTAGEGSPSNSRQGHLGFSTGISERINRWVSKAQHSGLQECRHLQPAKHLGEQN